MSLDNAYDLGRERQRSLDAVRANLDKRRGGGDDGGMPTDLPLRVGRLETDVAEIKGDVKRLSLDMTELKGRLGNMPTTFQMVSWVLGLNFGLAGLVFAIARVAR